MRPVARSTGQRTRKIPGHRRRQTSQFASFLNNTGTTPELCLPSIASIGAVGQRSQPSVGGHAKEEARPKPRLFTDTVSLCCVLGGSLYALVSCFLQGCLGLNGEG